MKPKRPIHNPLFLATISLAGILPAGAEPIALPNPGFETVQRAEGVDDYNKWANNQDVWRHWTRTENGGPLRAWNPGPSGVTFQGTLAYGFGGNAPEGNMVQLVSSRYSDIPTNSVLVPPQWDGVNYFSAACLVLDGTIGSPVVPAAAFDPTKIYTLTATVGKPPVFVTNSGAQNSTDPRRAQAAVWHGYAVQLAVGGTNSTGSSTYAGRVDGGTVVAQDSNGQVVPADGYRTVTTTYFPNPADAALTGQYLQLRLAALDNPADLRMTGYVVFDDVKLEGYAAPPAAYWDLNNTTTGAGGSTPGGTWDAAGASWNPATDGTGAAAPWTAGQTAVFAAGGDATGTYTVTVAGTQAIGGLAFEDGTVTLTGGTALQLSGIAMADVASGLTATIATPITEDAARRQLAKSGTGTLVLSAANSYSGGTTVLDGILRLGASGVLHDASPVTVTGRATGVTTLDLANHSDTVGGLILGGSATDTAALVSTGTGTLTLGGDVAFVNAVGNGFNPLGATISGKLDLGAAARTFMVNNSASAADDLTVAANISGAVAMSKVGKGTLVLSGNNAGATGGMIIEEGVTRFESAGAINGTARDVTVTTPGTVVFGPSFGAGNVPTVLANRIVASSDGIIAADNYATTNFDFNTAGLTTAFLGAVGEVSYTGTLTPNGTTYRLGGGGSTLTMGSANQVTGGGNSLVVGGKVTLAAANDHGGGTTILGGTVFPAGPVVLAIGNNGALGTGPLTFQAQPNASTVGVILSSDSSARTLANAIVLNGGINIAGTGDFNFTDTTPITLSATRLFVIGNPVTRFAQAFTGTGGITMDYTGPGTLIMAGNNTYTGPTLVNGGTLVLLGDNSAMTNSVTLSSRFGVPAVLVLGHDNALGGGTLTIGAVPASVTAQGTRTIANAIAANADFSIVGTDPLTLSGTMTLNNNRVITNSNTTSTTTLGTITGANRNLTFSGDGNSTVTGNITTGTGQLIKNGAGTLTLKGVNTYTGNTTVNAGGPLVLAGGSQTSAITVKNGAVLGFTPGLPTTSTKAVTLEAGAKIRIIGTPTATSHTLLTTTATITGTPELVTPVAGYQLVKEGETVLKLVSVIDADYFAWTAKFPGSDLGNPTGDFDGDGLTNDRERLFGLNPTLGSSANPLSVPLNPATGAFSFTRRDPLLAKYLYSVWTSTDLSTWTQDTGAVLTPGATVAEVQTVAVQLSASLLTAPNLFLRLRADKAPPPPPLLVADFEANNSGFTVATTSGTAWAYGDPESLSLGGGSITTGNGGSAKCWGTDLVAAYADATNTSLRTPVINLTGVTAANLSFALAIDAPAGHTLAVSVIDAFDNVIATLATLEDPEINSAAWQTVGPLAIPAAALGQQVRIQWRFIGAGDGAYLGAYLDDVVVAEP